jgi:hypothetical protein
MAYLSIYAHVKGYNGGEKIEERPESSVVRFSRNDYELQGMKV